MRFTDDERWFIANALRVAAEQYDADAFANAATTPDMLMCATARARLVRQFEGQAGEARRLARLFEM